MANLQAIADAVIKGDRDAVSNLSTQAVNEGTPVADVLEKGLIAGMAVVGKRFKANEVYVPEVLIAARAMKAGMTIIEPCSKMPAFSRPERSSWEPSRATCTTLERTSSA